MGKKRSHTSNEGTSEAFRAEIGASDDGREEADRRPLAAYRLGYLSRTLWVWHRLFWQSPRDDTRWDGVPFTVDQLRNARLVLAGDMHPNIFQGLADVLGKIERSTERLLEAYKRGDESIRWDATEPPARQMWRELRQLADGALSNGHALRGWYEFGVALGDYQLDLDDPLRPPRPMMGIEAAPDFGKVVHRAAMLPDNDVRQIPLLHSLVRLGSVYDRQGQDTYFRKFIEVNRRAGRLRTAVDDSIPVDRLMMELDPRIQEGLAKLEAGSVSGSTLGTDEPLPSRTDTSQGAAPAQPDPAMSGAATTAVALAEKPRDRFMYDEYLRGTTLGMIAVKVSERQEWDRYDSPSGVLAAVKRFAKKHKLELPRRQNRAKRQT